MKAYVFPGQGAQFPGMGKDLFVSKDSSKKLFELSNDILGFNISEIMFNGSEEDLKQTRVTQPAIFLHSVILAKSLGKNFKPDVVAGHSLGEISALVANECLKFEDGLELVYKRALAMQKACEETPSTMAAILGLEDAIVEKVCKEISGIVVPANYNCPGQLVISGEINAIDLAIEKLTEKGARRALKLPVGGAFHSPCSCVENSRYGFEDAVSKVLHLIINGYSAISANKIKETYKSNQNIRISDTEPKSLKQTYKFLEKGFNEMNLNPKLKKWSSITLPLVILDLKKSYKISNKEKSFAEAFMKLEEKRQTERNKPENQQDPKIINFNDAARADDPSRLESRSKFLKRWFLSEIPSLEYIDRDNTRLFTSDQRTILYYRSGGKCQICHTDISQDNFDADHIIKHTDGGKTTLENGRALCVPCNRGRG